MLACQFIRRFLVFASETAFFVSRERVAPPRKEGNMPRGKEMEWQPVLFLMGEYGPSWASTVPRIGLAVGCRVQPVAVGATGVGWRIARRFQPTSRGRPLRCDVDKGIRIYVLLM